MGSSSKPFLRRGAEMGFTRKALFIGTGGMSGLFVRANKRRPLAILTAIGLLVLIPATLAGAMTGPTILAFEATPKALPSAGGFVTLDARLRGAQGCELELLSATSPKPTYNHEGKRCVTADQQRIRVWANGTTKAETVVFRLVVYSFQNKRTVLIASHTFHLIVAAELAPREPSGPSGEAMPTSSPTGERLVFADDFPGTSLDSNWTAYSGGPSGDAAGWWDPSHVEVSDGLLGLRSYEDPTHYGGPSGDPPWVEGGVSSAHGLRQTYGEYLVRSRVTSATGVTQVELLWPANGSWPPEIDFNESNGTAGFTTASLIWRTSTDPQAETQTLDIDLTQWHTWGVIWRPGEVVYTVDGKVWATMTSPNVPSGPMVLDLQQQVWPCGGNFEACPNSATPAEVDMEVAWVVAYAPND
jgi:beta-glucanase (GH16 family)